MQLDIDKIKISPAYIGFILLKEIKKEKKISLYKLYAALKKNNMLSSRQLIIGLSFLYSLNLIEFKEANIWCKK